MKKLLIKIASFVANLIPTKNMICFSSFPDFSDNAYALYAYLLKEGLDVKYKMVWLIVDKNILSEIKCKVSGNSNNTLLLYKYSIRGLWSYIRSRFVFETHGIFPFLMLGQHPDKQICLWHGMPLKLIGACLKEGDSCSKNANYTICSSKLFQPIMAKSFSFDNDRVLITGQPRCDLLFEKTDWFEINRINREEYEKIGIWMPTYRKSIIGDILNDGIYKDNGVSILKEEELQSLDIFLRKKRILLLVKLHPMDALQEVEYNHFSNIVIIKPKEFKSQLYPLLGACDFLLTDYSSVFIDYQILKRPIGFVMDDIETYRSSRGFYFDNIETILPGPIISDYYTLCSFIENPYYLESNVSFNDYFDCKSSERVCKKLGIIK